MSCIALHALGVFEISIANFVCEKYRPRGNQHQEEEMQVFSQFLTWLFETDLDERRNRNYRISQNQ